MAEAGGETNSKPLAFWEIDFSHPEEVHSLGIDGSTLDCTPDDFAFEAVAIQHPEALSEAKVDVMTPEDRSYYAALVSVISRLIVIKKQNGEIYSPPSNLIVEIEAAAKSSSASPTSFLHSMNQELTLIQGEKIGLQPNVKVPKLSTDPILFPMRQVKGSRTVVNPEGTIRAWLDQAYNFSEYLLQQAQVEAGKHNLTT